MNNVPGMTFGFDGPSVTGWWVNPKTGDKFKAIDTFFEDNRLLIKTAVICLATKSYFSTNNALIKI